MSPTHPSPVMKWSEKWSKKYSWVNGPIGQWSSPCLPHAVATIKGPRNEDRNRNRAAIIVGMEIPKYFSRHCFEKHFPLVSTYESKWEQAAILNGRGQNSPTTMFLPSASQADRLARARYLYLFAWNHRRRVVYNAADGQLVIEARCFDRIGSIPFVRTQKFEIRDNVPLESLRVMERQHVDDRGQVYVMINMYPIY